jgi:hypothetical protein
MSEEECVAIEIVKKFPFFGSGETLETRLRKVQLKGFQNTKIYQNAQFEIAFLTPEQIKQQLYTPQPSVYQTHLEKVDKLARLFSEKGIDISNLDSAFDYIATSSSGAQTNWTILPPVVEVWNIPVIGGKLNYSPLIGTELQEAMKTNGWSINPHLSALSYNDNANQFHLINDGAHRIHWGFMNKGMKILRIKGVTSGFPYYAAPQPYDSIKVAPIRDINAPETKIHVIESPGHKHLYRLFPSGGIMSGELRPLKTGKVQL